MGNTFFDNPPVLSGKPEEQLVQLKNYLFTVSNKLNDAFMEVSIQEQKAEEQRTMTAAGGGTAEAAEPDSTFLKTKQLIIKTAKIVRNEMQEIQLVLQGNIKAISDQFGTYERNIDQKITLSVEGALQDFNIDERITTVENDTEEFLRQTHTYIFSGIVNPTTNEAGIAIGYNVTDEETGNLIHENKMATFTAKRLSFYLNGVEVSYFSNDVFYIAKGEVTDNLKIGNFIFKKFSNGSMGLMKT